MEVAVPLVGGEKVTAPYGSWKSPITADVVASEEKRLGGIGIAGDGRLVWVETRPSEGGLLVMGTASAVAGTLKWSTRRREFLFSSRGSTTAWPSWCLFSLEIGRRPRVSFSSSAGSCIIIINSGLECGHEFCVGRGPTGTLPRSSLLYGISEWRRNLSDTHCCQVASKSPDFLCICECVVVFHLLLNVPAKLRLSVTLVEEVDNGLFPYGVTEELCSPLEEVAGLRNNPHPLS
ncbi:hypothetical protein Cni_G28785 [Canna indica]|uniref:Uncharacterized protein n=1 Tax=Canna indica TaxID=4628 RepID=A0AAQ3L3C8_9LILI|nr:hypothetical protein Cni_G28785 [Canna indica]